MKINVFNFRKSYLSIVICLLISITFINASYSHPVSQEIKDCRKQIKTARDNITNEIGILGASHRALVLCQQHFDSL